MNKKLPHTAAIFACIALLSGCHYVADPQPVSTATVYTFASLSSSSESQTSNAVGIELDNGVYIVDGIPYWNKADKKPLLELAPTDSEEQKQSEAVRRRWLGRGGTPYHYRALTHSFVPTEEIDQMPPEYAAENYWITNYIDEDIKKILEEYPPETRERLLEYGLDINVLLDYLYTGLTPEFFFSLNEVQKEALVELYTPAHKAEQKMEEMGMIFPRVEMTGTEECLLLVLSQPSDEEFRQQAEEQNIPHWMQDELLRRGNMRSEILSMTEEDREKALIPAINNYLYYKINNGLDEEFWLTEAGSNFLEMRYRQMGGISECNRLKFLGYSNYDLVMISDEELELLFPLEELPEKLNQYGFSDEEIARYETRLKYIVREALQIKESLEQ